MDVQWKFEIAIAVWKCWQSADSEFDEALSEIDFDQAEEFLLDSTPANLRQAELMLELIAVNVGAGPRCDGREVGALRNVAQFIRQTVTGNQAAIGTV